MTIFFFSNFSPSSHSFIHWVNWIWKWMEKKHKSSSLFSISFHSHPLFWIHQTKKNAIIIVVLVVWYHSSSLPSIVFSLRTNERTKKNFERIKKLTVPYFFPGCSIQVEIVGHCCCYCFQSIFFFFLNFFFWFFTSFHVLLLLFQI